MSQFTLQASLKGHKPDLRNAMGPAPAKDLYTKLLKFAKSSYHPSKIQGTRVPLCVPLRCVACKPCRSVSDSDCLSPFPLDGTHRCLFR